MGRGPELEAVARFLDTLVDGPATLALEGDPGIGKTTLWNATLDDARRRGLRVLSSRPAATEVQLGLAGLADLLEGIDRRLLDAVPPVQRRALDAALLADEGDGGPPDPRAVGAGLLSVVEALAEDGAVLVAIDDLQWLDASSLQVVAFAARRWSGPVGLVTAQRVGADRPGRDLATRDPDRVARVRLSPLTSAEVHQLLLDRTGRSLAPPPLRRLNSVAGGNPFYALELARALGPTWPPGEAPLPATLVELVSARVERLAPDAREVLVVASALPSATVDRVQRATGRTDVADLLASAEEDGVITLVGGVVRFTHPLLARGVYDAAPRGHRRRLHRRLGELADDPEERARHLALAAVEPDAETLEALDVAAAAARRRGAPAAAAELLEMALGLGERSRPEDAARLVQAAADHLEAGDLHRTEALLDRAVDAPGPGALQARALTLKGVGRLHRGHVTSAVDLLRRAVERSDGDPQLTTDALPHLAFALTTYGQIRSCAPVAQACLADAERLGDPARLAGALGTAVMVDFMLGNGVDTDRLDRGLALETQEAPIPLMYRPTLISGLVHLWTGRVDDAAPALEAVHRETLERGAESSMSLLEFWMLMLYCWQGRLDRADHLASELAQRAPSRGWPGDDDPYTSTAVALTAAWRGDEGRARSAAERALAMMAEGSMVSFASWPASALGFLDLSLDRYQEVVAQLAPMARATTEMGIGEGLLTSWVPDLIEALVALGRIEEAEPLIARLEQEARSRPRPWSAAVAGRGRGLWLAARGDLDGAEAALRTALDHHARLAMPHDRARTQVALGQVLRRRRRRREALDVLSAALTTFDRIGTVLWAARARREVDRLGLRRGPSDDLTPSEARTVDLAATGLTNREVAAALFVSPKTVEANLSRAYRKLGIRSRAELGRYAAEHRLPPPEEA